MIRIILRNDSADLLNFLKKHEIGYTIVDGEGAQKKVKILFSVLQRQDLPQVMQAINRYNPKAFYSIEDVRTSSAGIFPTGPKGVGFMYLGMEERRNRKPERFWKPFRF